MPSSPVWPAGRRVGYLVAIVVNVLIILFINSWPTWRVFPFLTSTTPDTLWAFDGSLLTAVAFNVSLAIAHRTWVLLVRDLVAAAWAIVVLAVVWVVYPFRFATSAVVWHLLVEFIVGVGIAGAVVGLVVQSVRLARLAVVADRRS